MQESERYIHDAYMAHAERTEKRLWIAIIVLAVVLLISNAAWIYYESQFEDVVTTTIDATQDGEGVNIVSGEDALNVTEGQNY